MLKKRVFDFITQFMKFSSIKLFTLSSENKLRQFTRALNTQEYFVSTRIHSIKYFSIIASCKNINITHAKINGAVIKFYWIRLCFNRTASRTWSVNLSNRKLKKRTTKYIIKALELKSPSFLIPLLCDEIPRQRNTRSIHITKKIHTTKSWFVVSRKKIRTAGANDPIN